MTSLFDKLNLRPSERRLVVGVGIVVFLFLNWWLVFPHFGDLSKIWDQTGKSRELLALFQGEIGRQQEYATERTRLAQQGQTVALEAQALELQKKVASQAAMSGVAIQTYDSRQRTISRYTNAFFDEQSLVIKVLTGETELVNFLYSLAEHNSLIRVRSMTLQPAAGRHRLDGNITIVASYQKKTSRSARAAPATTPEPARAKITKPTPPAPRSASTPKVAPPTPRPATNTSRMKPSPRRIPVPTPPQTKTP